ncbi:hypothetical protein [Endozoicomonas sp. 4G]|uniref:hypothetical protein n=1 Tax=Endozoicomonas sp. 4G TaxID=2872754 RepID=UPI00207867D0|nr:hypothetical protein [Endozoicomonas sp. 4G]
MQAVLIGFLLLFHLFQACDARDIYTSALWMKDLYTQDENKTIAVRLNAKLSFICPNVPSVAKQYQGERQVSEMYENMWLVQNETYYENCEIPEIHSDRVDAFICDNPNQLTHHRILFAEFVADPNYISFKGGKYYYIFSTSDGYRSSLHSRKGGHCLTDNMRIKIYVCKKRGDTNPLCKDPDPKLNIIPPSDPSTPSPLRHRFIKPVRMSVAGIITDNHNDIDSDTEAVLTGYNDSLPELVELAWEIGYNQTQTITLSDQEHYPVVALCKAPNTSVTLLNDKGTIVDNWLCEKAGERLTVLKPEYQNGDVYLLEATSGYRMMRAWKSKLFVNVRSISQHAINKANSPGLSALALLIPYICFSIKLSEL